jgi:hypothetical protein
MVRVHLGCVAIFLLAVLLNSPSLTAGPLSLPTEGLLDLDEAVFVGKIVATAPVPGDRRWETGGSATVAVSEVLKGNLGKEIKMKVVLSANPDPPSVVATVRRVDHMGDSGIWGLRGGVAVHKFGPAEKPDIDEIKRMLRLLERRTWSAPVQGVAVWAFLSADPIGRDGPRPIMFAARNVTTEPVYLPDSDYKGLVDIVVKDSKGKEYRIDRGHTREPEKTIFCKALDSHAVVYMHQMENYWYYSLPAGLPEGEYTLTAVLANDKDRGIIIINRKSEEWDAVKPWQGRLASPPIKFVVKDGKVIPAKELLDSDDARRQNN